MRVILDNIAKRFQFNWIIQNVNLEIPDTGVIGVSGRNGSGKSTLMSIISGYLSPSEGNISYHIKNQAINRDDIFRHINQVGPYISLIKEFTLPEQYAFHFKFRKLEQGSYEAFRDFLGMDYDESKQIGAYSSGMHQRLLIALSLYGAEPLLLLDEPTSYLDPKAKEWFYSKLSSQIGKKTIIVASNDDEDFQFCNDQYEIIQSELIIKQ